MFGCTPVKEEDDDELRDVHWSNVLRDNPDDDSESRQTVKENRNTYQTPEGKGKAKASDVFRTSPEKVAPGEQGGVQQSRHNLNVSVAICPNYSKWVLNKE